MISSGNNCCICKNRSGCNIKNALPDIIFDVSKRIGSVTDEYVDGDSLDFVIMCKRAQPEWEMFIHLDSVVTSIGNKG